MPMAEPMNMAKANSVGEALDTCSRQLLLGLEDDMSRMSGRSGALLIKGGKSVEETLSLCRIRRESEGLEYMWRIIRFD